MYKLKNNVPDFTVVDGPFEGRSYKAGETYSEIPPQEKHKFESVSSDSVSDKEKLTLKTDTDTGGKKK